MRSPVPALTLTVSQREVLETVARSQSGAHREVLRAKALLMAAEGLANTIIAGELSVAAGSVANWRARFAEEGLARFGRVRKGRGRKPSIPQEKIDEIVDLTQNYRPKGQTHWSCRTMAEAAGVSKDTVQRIWSARGLKPYRGKTFTLSNDPRFEDKLVEVVGQRLPRHRHQEFETFLRTIDREVPKDLDIHLILDNFATHEHEKVRTWLDKHPRFHLHFMPTSSSWLNLVERRFREMTDTCSAAQGISLRTGPHRLDRGKPHATTKIPDRTNGPRSPDPSARGHVALEKIS